MNDRKYHINDIPASEWDIIIKAKEYDVAFAASNLHEYNIAADILRQHGFKIGLISENE